MIFSNFGFRFYGVFQRVFFSEIVIYGACSVIYIETAFR